jgi:hypothetical protein
MRATTVVLATALIVWLTANAGATGASNAPATSSPYAAAKLQGWAQTLRNAADGFTAGAQQKVELNKEWQQRVFEVSKEACTMGKELIAWHDAQPPAAWDAIYACLQNSRGAWMNGCDLQRTLEASIGCGGSNGPAYCYEGFASAAISSANALDAWAACVNLGIPAQAQADAAAAAKAQAVAAAQNGAQSGQQNGSASTTTTTTSDRDAEEQTKREQAKRDEAKRDRDSQVHAAYDARSAEIERRNQIANRWQRGVQAQQEQLAAQTRSSIALMNAIEGGGNTVSGASWRAHIFLGGGGVVFPVYADATGVDINSYSFVGRAGGMGLDGSLELWPYFGPHIGVAAAVEGAMGWFPTVNGSSIAWEGYFALRGFAGSDGHISALFEAGHAWRQGGYSADIGGGFADAFATGTASYELNRLGIGGRYCVWSEVEDSRFCMGGLDAMLMFDLLGFEPMTSKRPIVGRLSFWGRGMFLISVDVGLSYPAAGTPTYATDDNSGTFVLFRIEKGWDWFGDPYGETDEQRKKRLERQKELRGQ